MEQKRLSELQKDFINNMTHEFKTPLSSIKIAADFLATDPHVKNDGRLHRYVQIIKDQNLRLNNQVEKVLNVAHMEKDSIELKKEVFEINETLSSVINNESLKLKHGNISFNGTIQPVYILADKLHFINVVANMIDNAIKYSGEDPKVDISLQESDHAIQMHIKDNGIGIDKDNIKKLFEKFFRVSTGDVHNVKGFGLGLYYVNNICNSHGWKIRVESEINEGTEFIITIPKYKEA